MMDPDNDTLPEELADPALMTDLKELHQQSSADLQSLARIQSRLQAQRAAPHLVPPMLSRRSLQTLSSTDTLSGKGTHMHQHSLRNRRAANWLQYSNKIVAVLVTALLVGALVATFTLLHRSSTGSGTTNSSNINAHGYQPFTWSNMFVPINSTTAWVSTAVPMPGKGDIGGPLLRTSDGGKSWQDVTPPQQYLQGPTYRLNNQTVLKDGTTAWTIINSDSIPGTLLRTLDAGRSWQKMSLPDNIFVSNISFIDKNHGSIIGVNRYSYSPLLYFTHDGGATWQQPLQMPQLQAKKPVIPMTILQFVNAKTGYVFFQASNNDAPELFVTHDEGNSWSEIALPTGVSSYTGLRLTFFDEHTGYLVSGPVGKTFQVYATHDGGQSWQGPVTLSLPDMKPYAESMTFVNDHQLVVQGSDEIVWFTLTNGQWVKSADYRNGLPLVSSAFVSSTIGMAVVDYTQPGKLDYTTGAGDDIALLKTSDGGASWTRLKFTVPTQKLTSYTMAYLTNPGWTYYSVDEESGTTSFIPRDQNAPQLAHPAHLPQIQARKWLVRFMCNAPTATVALNGQQFTTPNCDQHPVSRVVTFATPQSFQEFKVNVQGNGTWLVALQACTNEKVCRADS